MLSVRHLVDFIIKYMRKADGHVGCVSLIVGFGDIVSFLRYG